MKILLFALAKESSIWPNLQFSLSLLAWIAFFSAMSSGFVIFAIETQKKYWKKASPLSRWAILFGDFFFVGVFIAIIKGYF